MDDYLVGVLSNIGVISFIALSAYLLLLTGEISFGQQAFFAIGAYAAGIATALWGWPLSAGARVGRRRSARRGGRAGRHADAAAARALLRGRDARLRRDGAARVRAVPLSGDDRRRAGRARTAPTVSAASATSSRTTSAPLQFLLLIYALLAGACSRPSCCSSARASASSFRMIGEDAMLAALNGIAVARVQGARRRPRRRARRARRRALRASDHLRRAAHLRRHARRAQSGLWPDRRARHRVRPAARRRSSTSACWNRSACSPAIA